MVILLATSFLMILSTSAFGQNKSYLHNIPGSNQIDLFSAEILSLVNIIVKETNLFHTDQKLALGIDNANMLSFDKAFETTPTNYNRSMLNTTVFNENTLSKSSEFSQFIKPLMYAPDLSHNIPHPFLDKNKYQNFAKENCESVKCLNGQTDWFELDNESWRTDDKMQQKPAVSSFGDWHFKVSSLENNYLLSPLRFKL